MESNQYVVEFLETNEPTKEQMVKAYSIRDEYINKNNRDFLVNQLTKLGYNLEKIQDYGMMKQRKYVMDQIETSYEKFIDGGVAFVDYNSILDSYNKSEEFKKNQMIMNDKIKRFGELSSFIDGTHAEFYSALTRDELIYLGW